MPNRILRDWTASDKIHSLSIYGERFFTRLIMKADDYGCFYAGSKLLKANLFPLFDDIREADLLRWIAECVKAGLIILYENAGKRYLQIVDFRQRLDKAKSKFPLPTSTESVTMDNEFPPEVEVETETEVEGKGTPPPPISGNGKKEKLKKITGAVKDHLFTESPFYDFLIFEAAFEGTDYELCNLKYYHERIKNWSAGDKKKKDWIATARNWMLEDAADNKLKLKPGVTNGTGENLSYQDRLVEGYRKAASNSKHVN